MARRRMDRTREDFRACVAANISRIRTEAGLSQDEAAARAGWSRSTWRGYEEARTVPSFQNATIIADVLGCRVGDLGMGQDTQPGTPTEAVRMRRWAFRVLAAGAHYGVSPILADNIRLCVRIILHVAAVSRKEPPQGMTRTQLVEYLSDPD